ncbi:hypothetical protein [Paenibacillus sp. HJGM_3]|uniref:hypothetical protein n=1 Tax=Paenibacillus sp. HJGM_3 TaxID=3379816 RepID=UPI00385CCEEB
MSDQLMSCYFVGIIYIFRDSPQHEAYEAHDSYVNARNFIADCLVSEGFLSRDGKVELILFSKNTVESYTKEKNDIVIAHHKNIGFLPDKDVTTF